MSTPSLDADALLDRITKEVWGLGYDLQQFKFAFAEDPRRVDIMNAVAPRFFVRWQLLVYDRILLGIARLFDPAEMSANKNISFRALLAANNWTASEPEKHTRVEDALAKAREACRGCIAHRHKRISHWDQIAASDVHVLPPANLKLASDGIASVQKLLEQFYEAMHRGTVSFDVIGLGEDDTERLFDYLSKRRSQRQPVLHARIEHVPGNRDADLLCPYCGEREPIAFYPRGVPSPAQMSRWHYDRCDGVIGCETISVDVIDTTGVQQTHTIQIDLRRPTRETE